MPSLPICLHPNYITYREPAISEPSPTKSGRFDSKNRPVQKRKYKVIKQVYRVKKDGRLNKNSDLTQDKEKPTVKETSASSINKIVPDIEHISNDMAEQHSSSAGEQDKKEKTGDKPTGLTGTQTGLTGASSESESSSKSKMRLSFKEFLAKYEKQGATQKKKKQMGRLSKAKDETSSRSCEQLDSRSSQSNCSAMSYSGPVVPWF